jgi:hypothetical protein
MNLKPLFFNNREAVCAVAPPVQIGEAWSGRRMVGGNERAQGTHRSYTSLR